MIACKHCQSQNGLDAKFCKICGLALPESAIQEATQKHEQLISEGYALFNAGREDAVEAVRAATDGFGADVCIEAVGNPRVLEQAFFARDLAGTVVQVGVPTPDMRSPP